ncbi:MAG TPA: class I tRNA ligase family protein [Rhizomicrobium sp.]
MTGLVSTVIVAPPPTPNGDLHLGHLSGPYLGADVTRRYLLLHGCPALTALSIDTNQSYVITSAERQGVEAPELVDGSFKAISSTLAAAGIEFDVFGRPDDAYAQYVQEWFRKLYQSGVLERRSVQIPFDVSKGRYLFESYISGLCPTCLSPTKGNICEECGHPNEPLDLHNRYVTGSQASRIEFRSVTGYSFDLETCRSQLMVVLDEFSGQFRPGLQRLVKELLARRLPSIPITFPSSWGIQAPFPASSGLVLNPWVEMLPGHYYWLNKAAAKRGLGGAWIEQQQEPTNYIQYFGFDNSFYYAILHLGLALVARRCGLPAMMPTALRSNEFCELGRTKFSTSQGNVIWGRDFLKTTNSDALRYFLCRNNPENQRISFSNDAFDAVVHEEFEQPWAELISKVSCEGREDIVDTPQSTALLRRFEAAYGGPIPSLRLAAQTLATGVQAALQCTEDRETLTSLARGLAIGAWPIVPSAAQRLWEVLSDGPVRWPSPPLAMDLTS